MATGRPALRNIDEKQTQIWHGSFLPRPTAAIPGIVRSDRHTVINFETRAQSASHFIVHFVHLLGADRTDNQRHERAITSLDLTLPKLVSGNHLVEIVRDAKGSIFALIDSGIFGSFTEVASLSAP